MPGEENNYKGTYLNNYSIADSVIIYINWD